MARSLFIDYGGKATANGASVDPSIFAGKTQAQIADDIANPSSTISKAVLGSANVIRAAVPADEQPAGRRLHVVRGHGRGRVPATGP